MNFCFWRAAVRREAALGSPPIFIGDDVRYSPDDLLLPKQYHKYVENIIIPNGLLMDRVEKMVSDEKWRWGAAGGGCAVWCRLRGVRTPERARSFGDSRSFRLFFREFE